MKKLLALILLLFLFIPCVFSAEWIEVFHKEYFDKSSIEYNSTTQIVKFWAKIYRTENTFPDLPNFDYFISKWAIDLKNRKSKIEALYIYDKKDRRIYSDDTGENWKYIVPDKLRPNCYYQFFHKIYLE